MTSPVRCREILRNRYFQDEYSSVSDLKVIFETVVTLQQPLFNRIRSGSMPPGQKSVLLLRRRLADVTSRLGERPDAVGAELAAEARLSDAAERHARVLGCHAVTVDTDRARDELRAETLSASASSPVHTDAVRPKSVAFAAATASSMAS